MSSTDATVIGGADAGNGDAPAIDGVLIERELGRGGMGAVWLGRQTYLDRAVAIKALTLQGDEAFAARFRREARILAGLSHPHIVACHQAGMAPDGRPFLVMEFVDGPDLKQHVAAQGPLAPADAARLVAEVAEGLRHAHTQGIIHRDVKPDNVLLTRRPDGSWTAKLADLGLARTSQAVKGDLTAAGQVLGTPSTMAPEQFDDPDAVDHRADLYGLGCVLHHALTGAPAFTGSSFAELVASKVHGPPPNPARLRPDLPPVLTALCTRLLSRDREQRPGYDEVIATLRAPLSPPASRRPWPLIAIAAAAVLVLIAATAFLTRPPGPRASAHVEPRVAVLPSSPVITPHLTSPIALFGSTFDQRLAGWTITDPLAWGVSEDREDLAISGRSGEIVHPLPAMPGRIIGTVTVPPDGSVTIGLRDAQGRTIGLRLLPLDGLIASLVRQDTAGVDTASAGSATTPSRDIRFTLTIADGQVSGVVEGATVLQPLLLDLPAPSIALVLAVDGRSPALFHELRAEP